MRHRLIKFATYRHSYSKIQTFKCSLESAKRSFYRAANAVFSKIGRTASGEVTLVVIKSKMLAGAIVWFISVSTICIVLACTGMCCEQIFHEIIYYECNGMLKICQDYFVLPSRIVEKRRNTFYRPLR